MHLMQYCTSLITVQKITSLIPSAQLKTRLSEDYSTDRANVRTAAGAHAVLGAHDRLSLSLSLCFCASIA